MIRLAWHQFRAEGYVALGALGVVAVVLAVTGPHLVAVYETNRNQLATTYPGLQTAVAALLIVVPALLGLFFGAPLVARELETGTYRLAWTQSVSRARWLTVKLAFVGGAASLLAGGLSLMAAWWANPINVTNANRFSPAAFGMFGIVPFGYALFAFALGASTGLLFRRTLPAMATTLAGYFGARVAVTYWIRPHFEAPLHRTVPFGSNVGVSLSSGGSTLSITAYPPPLHNGWGLSASLVDKAGNPPTSEAIRHACPALLHGPGPKGAGGPGAVIAMKHQFQNCFAHLSASYHEVVSYQPASRYWPFQIYETALFVALAVALGALSVWWMRRRLV